MKEKNGKTGGSDFVHSIKVLFSCGVYTCVLVCRHSCVCSAQPRYVEFSLKIKYTDFLCFMEKNLTIYVQG